MINKEGIQKNWLKISDQLKKAEEFLEGEEIDDALYYIWMASENLVNSLKTTLNGVYMKEHSEKSEILKVYFLMKVLKNDYSSVFEKLCRYRLAAAFEPYTSIKKNYVKIDVEFYLKMMSQLKAEIEAVLKERGVLR